MLAHTLHVVRIARQICANLPFPAEERATLAPLLVQLAAFHDLGKCASGFQAALRQKQAWGHRHEILSTALGNTTEPAVRRGGFTRDHYPTIAICLPGTTRNKKNACPTMSCRSTMPRSAAMVAELQENSAGAPSFPR